MRDSKGLARDVKFKDYVSGGPNAETLKVLSHLDPQHLYDILRRDGLDHASAEEMVT